MDFIRCLRIPLAESALLLPNVVVAEVLDYIEPEASAPHTLPEKPPGYLGAIDWHGETIDLLTWEVYAGEPMPPPRLTQCIVVVRLPDHARLPRVLALLSQRIPHLLTLTPEKLQRLSGDEALKAWPGMPVWLNEALVWIPDLGVLQRDWNAD